MLIDGFVVEGIVMYFWCYCFNMFIQYFDVVVQWDQGDDEFCVLFIYLLLQCFVEVDRKMFNLDIVVVCYLKMVKFMYCNQYVKCNDKSCQILEYVQYIIFC